MRVLVAYATTHGQTAKVAGRVAEVARRRGDSVDVVAVQDDREVSPVGLRRRGRRRLGAMPGRHQAELVRWLQRAPHDAERARPTAPCCRCRSAPPRTATRRAADAREMLDRLLDDTGVDPGPSTLAVAGALRYRHYDVADADPDGADRRPPRAARPAPDTELEFTDWAALERFADTFLDAASVATRPDTAPEVPA